MSIITFLVVEDHPRLRGSLCAWLRHAYVGCECVEAETGTAALAQSAAAPPHVVLLDVSLPDMSGLVVAQQLLARFPGLPIIIITMHDAALYRDDARAIGAAAFVPKDQLPSALASALHAILAREADSAGSDKASQ